MKVCVIQPPYSTNHSQSEEYFRIECDLLDQCDESMDIIVMPEMSDIPCLAKTQEQRLFSINSFNKAMLDKAAETAMRCNAMVFVNARYKTEKGYRNTTYAFDRKGNITGKYFKSQLTPGERLQEERDDDYLYEFSEPTVVEMEGIRFGFLTCYDFYFYEKFAAMARQNLDVIIGCSHQRSDTHEALELMSRFLAYNTNAYVIRSSVSMGEDSELGGVSCVVAPDGKVLVNMLSRTGLGVAEIDVNQKYYKPAGFGNPPAAHYEYIERGRCPWNYRPGGSFIVPDNSDMPYPRVCAHRGFNTIAPENSMPAFGAAIAMGADEIEFDLWETKDGEIVSIHDPGLERVSDGEGYVYEHTYDELLKYDFGIKHGEKFKGMKILKFEDILKQFSCQVIMNIHLKMTNVADSDVKEVLSKIVSLIDKYDCRRYVYFMCDERWLIAAKEIAPDICRCCSGGGTDELRWSIVERAINYDCQMVQLVKDCFNQEMIDKAHAHGIICNVWWSNDPDEAREFIAMGADTLLTDDYNLIANAVK